MATSRQVLPTNVRPVHYDLSLRPNLTSFHFDGRVIVKLDVNEDTKIITLNSHELKLTSAKLQSSALKTQSSQEATDISYDEQKHIVTLTFAESVPAKSETVLDILFEGTLNDQMAGFYRSSYKDASGETKYLATTQFEATDARRAFPCWDEPSLKATFDVTLVVPSELTALSNMNVISEKPFQESGKGPNVGKHEGSQTGKDVATSTSLKEVKYATTPMMSTYLLAFVVGPFEYIEAHTTGEHNGESVKVRVYTLPGSTEQGRHALNVCTKALEYFAAVFGEPYPLPKMDMVAIPDFEAGAMENWGLVTYRTVALLFDEKASSLAAKKQTAYTVCHELAHQWFGNLVTMEWWDHLWLNEGFATWVGWLAVDHVFPDWDVWTSFVNEDMPRALSLDALRSSHPIEVAVNDPAEIHQIFDAISYYKGASVIRMLSSWLGVDVFLAGVRRYLHRHKFGNASTGDLWAALSEVAGVDVSKFMQLWTKNVGYPVLRVDTVDDSNIQVTQARYLSTGDLKSVEDTTNWWVPLGVLTPDKVESYTLTDKSQRFAVGSHSFKLNAGQSGVYRVQYPIDVIKRLADEVRKPNNGLLSNTADRVGLVADAGSLCVSGEQTTSAFLELAQAFQNETEYFVWSQISTHLSNILSVWYEQPSEVKDGLNLLRRNLFSPIAHKLGWEFKPTDDYLTNMLRVLVLSNAGRSGDQGIVDEARDRFWRFVKGDNEALHPNLRGPVYNIVLKNANDETEETQVWEEILKIYENETLTSDQRLAALATLGNAKSEALINRYLAMSLDEKQVRGQDSVYVFRTLGSNPDARNHLWEFFSNNYDLLHTKFSKSLSLFGIAVKSSVDGFVDDRRIEEIEAFFANKDTKEYARPLQQAIEAAKVNAEWLKRDSQAVQDWVRGYVARD
ncbi:hypothetical protein K450DRAFT_249048 [Umbelopsis ramanniana AG]|uniref:Aminopeptidase n=1 Tax=Umbelopsis ramanniana AG TaxID=1314678 RepID=A0AAD5HDE2_UMBRA|nr:uncharacterized protein K450DRAFT_249048 [Umbelopsis ramanniana AG]KAI8578103.1 hypothetical protein K450DRAFT_249048 [Umbelopsis ramanniana AG]